MTVNIKKTLAVLVTGCFLLTSVGGQAVASVADNARATQQYKQIFSDFMLPYTYGKITDAHFASTDRVIINIQDLHCHPKVQKNISNIIDLFDKKYGVQTVYLEGAYGDVDTSWITKTGDSSYRNTILEKMIATGRLTGAEYYSAISGKTNIIKGLEKKEPYLENLKRFGAILENREKINVIMESVKRSGNELRTKYYDRRQLKLEELAKQYSQEKISTEKYYALLLKHIDRLGIDLSKYENTLNFMSLFSLQKELKYTEITRDLQLLVSTLKQTLPASAYMMLANSTDNFSQSDKLYGYLVKITRQYNLDLSVNFPELDKYFKYIELSQKINPLELLHENYRLTEEINSRFSNTKAQSDVVFLVNFERYLNEYLTSKITSDDYEYYKNNIARYKKLWAKYVDNKVLSLLDEYIAQSDAFYKINTARNNYFTDNIFNEINISAITPSVKTDNEISNIIENMAQAKRVDVIITGGFHTNTVSEILKNHNASYIVITPNVTDGLKTAEETYYKIAKEQSKISFQALANLIASLSPVEQKRVLILVDPSLESKLGFIADVQEGALNENQLKQLAETVKMAGVLLSDDGNDIKQQLIQNIKDRLEATPDLAQKTDETVLEYVDMNRLSQALEKTEELQKLIEYAVKIKEAKNDTVFNQSIAMLEETASNIMQIIEALQKISTVKSSPADTPTSTDNVVLDFLNAETKDVISSIVSLADVKEGKITSDVLDVHSLQKLPGYAKLKEFFANNKQIALSLSAVFHNKGYYEPLAVGIADKTSTAIDTRLFDGTYVREGETAEEALNRANAMLDCLSDEMRDTIAGRYANPNKSFKIAVKDIKADRRAEFFKLAGKDISADTINGLADKTVVGNTLQVPWEYLVADAEKYGDEESVNTRKQFLIDKQIDGAIVTLSVITYARQLANSDNENDRQRATDAKYMLSLIHAGWSANNSWSNLAFLKYPSTKEQEQLTEKDGFLSREEILKDWEYLRAVTELFGLQREDPVISKLYSNGVSLYTKSEKEIRASERINKKDRKTIFDFFVDQFAPVLKFMKSLSDIKFGNITADVLQTHSLQELEIYKSLKKLLNSNVETALGLSSVFHNKGYYEPLAPGIADKTSTAIDTRLFDGTYVRTGETAEEALNRANAMLDCLSDEMRDTIAGRYANPNKSFKIAVKDIKADRRAEFFKLAGKDISADTINGLADKTVVGNTLQVPWEYLVADAEKYGDEESVNTRKQFLIDKQIDGVIVAMVAIMSVVQLYELANSDTSKMTEAEIKKVQEAKEKLKEIDIKYVLSLIHAGWSANNSWSNLAFLKYPSTKEQEQLTEKDGFLSREEVLKDGEYFEAVVNALNLTERPGIDELSMQWQKVKSGSSLFGGETQAVVSEEKTTVKKLTTEEEMDLIGKIEGELKAIGYGWAVEGKNITATMELISSDILNSGKTVREMAEIVASLLDKQSRPAKKLSVQQQMELTDKIQDELVAMGYAWAFEGQQGLVTMELISPDMLNSGKTVREMAEIVASLLDEQNRSSGLTMTWLSNLLDFLKITDFYERQKWINTIENPIIILGLFYPAIQKWFIKRHKDQSPEEVQQGINEILNGAHFTVLDYIPRMGLIKMLMNEILHKTLSKSHTKHNINVTIEELERLGLVNNNNHQLVAFLKDKRNKDVIAKIIFETQGLPKAVVKFLLEEFAGNRNYDIDKTIKIVKRYKDNDLSDLMVLITYLTLKKTDEKVIDDLFALSAKSKSLIMEYAFGSWHRILEKQDFMLAINILKDYDNSKYSLEEAGFLLGLVFSDSKINTTAYLNKKPNMQILGLMLQSKNSDKGKIELGYYEKGLMLDLIFSDMENMSAGDIDRINLLFKKLEDAKILNLATENNALAIKIFLNSFFIQSINDNAITDIGMQYKIAIKLSRSIYSKIGDNIINLSTYRLERMIEVALESHYNVVNNASRIEVLNDEVGVFGLHNNETKYDKTRRFVPDGLNRILGLLDINPKKTVHLEIEDVRDAKQKAKEFLSFIADFKSIKQQYGLSGGYFLFNGHGTKNGLFYDENNYISVKDMTNALIEAYKSGVNLEEITIDLSCCYSYYFANTVIAELKKSGVEKYPQILTAAGYETILGYTDLTGESPLSNLHASIIEYLEKQQSKNELPKGHLSLDTVFKTGIYHSNSTVFITNDEIQKENDKLNEELKNILAEQDFSDTKPAESNILLKKIKEIIKNIEFIKTIPNMQADQSTDLSAGNESGNVYEQERTPVLDSRVSELTMTWLSKLLDVLKITDFDKRQKWINTIENPIIVLGIFVPGIQSWFIKQHKGQSPETVKQAMNEILKNVGLITADLLPAMGLIKMLTNRIARMALSEAHAKWNKIQKTQNDNQPLSETDYFAQLEQSVNFNDLLVDFEKAVPFIAKAQEMNLRDKMALFSILESFTKNLELKDLISLYETGDFFVDENDKQAKKNIERMEKEKGRKLTSDEIKEEINKIKQQKHEILSRIEELKILARLYALKTYEEVKAQNERLSLESWVHICEGHMRGFNQRDGSRKKVYFTEDEHEYDYAITIDDVKYIESVKSEPDAVIVLYSRDNLNNKQSLHIKYVAGNIYACIVSENGNIKSFYKLSKGKFLNSDNSVAFNKIKTENSVNGVLLINGKDFDYKNLRYKMNAHFKNIPELFDISGQEIKKDGVLIAERKGNEWFFANGAKEFKKIDNMGVFFEYGNKKYFLNASNTSIFELDNTINVSEYRLMLDNKDYMDTVIDETYLRFYFDGDWFLLSDRGNVSREDNKKVMEGYATMFFANTVFDKVPVLKHFSPNQTYEFKKKNNQVYEYFYEIISGRFILHVFHSVIKKGKKTDTHKIHAYNLSEGALYKQKEFRFSRNPDMYIVITVTSKDKSGDDLVMKIDTITGEMFLGDNKEPIGEAGMIKMNEIGIRIIPIINGTEINVETNQNINFQNKFNIKIRQAELKSEIGNASEMTSVEGNDLTEKLKNELENMGIMSDDAFQLITPELLNSGYSVRKMALIIELEIEKILSEKKENLEKKLMSMGYEWAFSDSQEDENTDSDTFTLRLTAYELITPELLNSGKTVEEMANNIAEQLDKNKNAKSVTIVDVAREDTNLINFVTLITKFALEIVSASDIRKELAKQIKENGLNTDIKSNLVITDDAKQADNLRGQGFNVVSIRTASSKQMKGRKGLIIGEREGKQIRAYLDKVTGELIFYSNDSTLDINNIQIEDLKNMFKQSQMAGINSKMFNSIEKIVIVENNSTLESVINAMKNTVTDGVSKPPVSISLDFSDRKDVASASIERIANGETNNGMDSNAIIFNASQLTAMSEKTIRNLQEKGYEIILVTDKISEAEEMISRLHINGAVIKTNGRITESELKKIKQISDSNVNGTQIIKTQMFIEGLSDETLSSLGDIYEQYSIIPVVTADSLYPQTGQKCSVRINEKDSNTAGLFERSNVISVISDKVSTVKKSADRLADIIADILKPATPKQKFITELKNIKSVPYDTGIAGIKDILKNKNSILFKLITSKEWFEGEDERANEDKLKTTINILLSENILNSFTKSRVEQFMKEGKYYEALGCIRGSVEKTVESIILSKLETDGVDIMSDKLKKYAGGILRDAIVITGIRLLAEGKDIEALLEDAFIDSNMTAREYFDSIMVRLNGQIKDIIKTNEYAINTLSDERSTAEAISDFKDFNLLMQDQVREKLPVKKMGVASSFAIRSILGAA
ncbi:hypothetical protein MASR1M68_15060 [Elusimicrobiota bacterium]